MAKADIIKLSQATKYSRRGFIKVILGAAAGSVPVWGNASGGEAAGKQLPAPVEGGSEAITRLQSPIGHIARVSQEESACVSCGICTMVCAMVHGDSVGSSLGGIWLERKPFDCTYISVTCQQCSRPECFSACEYGAFHIEETTGARVIDRSKCQGCMSCIDACVYDPPRIILDEESETAFKCDLCFGRPEGPACVEFCPRQALTLIKGSAA